MTDVPRPPFPRTLGERFWDRVAEERNVIAERRLHRDPSPATNRPAGVPPVRFGGTLATLGAVLAGLLALIVVAGIVVLAFAGWQRWSNRSSVPVEDRMPRAVPVVPTLEPAQSIVFPGAVAAAVDPDVVDPAPAEPAPVLVHVAGAVMQPGVVELPVESRVIDAVKAAGGPAESAELDRINLAAVVQDGQHVYVLAADELVAPVVRSANPIGSAEFDSGFSTENADSPVDINAASVRELERLPGVGPATASSIVEFRDKRGPFFEASDMLNVPGIGPAKFAAMESMIIVGPPVAAAGGP